ncbi:MAG TPA: GNAT family N-acetyltransferase [Cytophagales bacterium]|jgi:L-amino acid N-acyltransferase YncA|nr:GNAT family N-acetyltransferase [Cytophagales bacterium]
MITYTQAHSIDDLNGILALQKKNLARGLSPEEIQSQGFVTVDHTFEQMKNLNDYEKHVIAKDDDKVVAYVLAMTKQSRHDIPILIPMFTIFDEIIFKGKKVCEYNYLVVGQVCVGKEYRGQGIFDGCYAAYQNFYQHRYDFAITEIATSNMRSLQAHKRIGFQNIHEYTSPDGVKWMVVAWDWKKPD